MNVKRPSKPTTSKLVNPSKPSTAKRVNPSKASGKSNKSNKLFK